jgi:CHAD domain-containing protein
MSHWHSSDAGVNRTYQLWPNEPAGDGIRRIVCHQIEGAIRSSTEKQNGAGSPVHETRRHLKKARSALTFAAGEIERDVWKREDRSLRKVGQLISDVRDAEVRLETVRQLRRYSRGRKRSFRETEELLAFELDSFLAAFAEWPEEARHRLSQSLDRIRNWPLHKVKCKHLHKCVQKTYKEGRQALRIATKKSNTKRLHAFRKCAKDLSYQLRILLPLAPGLFMELNDELALIGRYLGQVHDLAFVDERLASFGPTSKHGERVLNTLIEAREKDLERTAIALGERFYAERPRRFAKRISRYFSEWEKGKTPHPTGEPQPATRSLN